MKRQRGECVNAILKLLEDYGPMTRDEITQHLGIVKSQISPVVSRLNRATPRAGKRIHILRYVYDQEGQRTYPRAVYAIGDREDARRPKPDPQGAKRRYNAKRKKANTMNFVFNLALPRRVYERRAANRAHEQEVA